MRWLLCWAALAAGLASGFPASAATIRHLEVQREGDAYTVRFEGVVDAEPDRVFALLTDFGRLTRLNPGIVEAGRVGTGDGEVRVRTVLEGCVAFFCRRMERVQRVRSSDRRLIRTRMVPADSDFRAGRGRWQLAAVAGGTRIRYRARMVPDFWVPPLIGPWAIKRELRDNLRILVKRLERLAASPHADSGAARTSSAP
ncbi:MAG TPA: SRPBCC family protein [Gammaproteobacteria bacterium]|nr:SRPBCC family protein [Gammaproteobacteria bacterium]